MAIDHPVSSSIRCRWLLSLGLGTLASTISVGISATAAWQRGSGQDERILLAAVGVMAVLGTHLLPALSRQAGLLVRAMGLCLWFSCGVYVAFGHTGYYLGTLEQAGNRRAAMIEHVQSAGAGQSPRTLSAILGDKAKLQLALTGLARLECVENCQAVRAREAALMGRIQVSEAEADEARRWQRAQDRLEQRRAELHVEPAVAQIASRLGMVASTVNLLTGLVFSLILEGLGCMCWYLVFRRHEHAVPRSAITTVTAVTADAGAADLAVTTDGAPDSVVAKVRQEVEAGRLPCTVTAIRKHLACSQGRASEIRRLIKFTGAADVTC